ncbi:MAG TPA: ATP-binding protein [Rhodanobacter sp.]|nr:ATP-binding protein [Rhodanobacter sp.]
MLGDQLIRNERVALVELIKNAYDADAAWVKVTFENFDENFTATTASKIIIEDDGVGMSDAIIREHWANPATPVKLLSKAAEGRSPGGRIIQGEKGIGRFALLKLGRNIQITTRTAKADEERVVTLNLSGYDTDFIQNKKPLFLDKLRVGLKKVDPAKVIVHENVKLGARRHNRRPHGTRIEISHLTSTWTRAKVEGVYEDMARLQSIFALGPEDKKRRDADPFEVLIHRNDRHEAFAEERRETLESLLQNNTVFRIEGKFDDKHQAFDFTIGRQRRNIKLNDPEFAGLAVFKEAFGKKGEVLQKRDVESGPFGFAFFVFDFNPDAEGKRQLSKPDKELIRDHRIYLYRDGIRVYPYGDPDDDWLQIDTRRGTVRAAEFLSNDQVTGYVTITQKDNPHLRDKTSREGLVDTGHPTDDFIALLQIFLAWVRAKPYQKYRHDLTRKSDVQVFKSQRVQGAFDELLSKADQLPAPMQETLHTAERDYRAERRYLVHRAEATENLAGVGLSVESASHDLQLAMQSTLRTIDTLLGEAQRGGSLDPDHVVRELQAVRGALGFVDAQLRDLQQLFKSTKQRRKDIRVIEVLEKVARLFKGMTDRAKITVAIQPVGVAPLVAKTTDAVLLQLFLNLFDNAVYWLETQPANKARKIEIVLDVDRQQLVFADNGPGIATDDLTYIFEPFYSGKGQDGRGLGLYIARQLLDRHDYRIEVASKRERVLSGANFLVSFVEEAQ